MYNDALDLARAYALFITKKQTEKFLTGTSKSSDEWTSENTILSQGEIGIETDTNKFKIGDGTSTWDILPYGGLVGPKGDPAASTWSSTNW